MRLLIVSCLLAISFAVKLKPFVPQELDRAHLDIARVQFQKQKELGSTEEKVKPNDINLAEAEWKVQKEATTQKTPGKISRKENIGNAFNVRGKERYCANCCWECHGRTDCGCPGWIFCC